MDLTTRSRDALTAAQQRAAGNGNPQLEPVHLLVSLLDDAEGIPSAASMCYDSKQRQLVIPMNTHNALAFIRLGRR